MLESVLGFLKEKDVEYKVNFPMSRLSTVGIGASAELVILPDSAEKTISAVKFVRENKLRYKMIGRMSNILPCDNAYLGVLIATHRLRGFSLDGDILSVCSGENLGSVATKLAKDGVGGLSAFCGIPGCVGGAVVGNAGAFGSEISDVLIDVISYDTEADETVRLSPCELGFGYRKSALKGECRFLVLGARFRTVSGDGEKLLSEIAEIRRRRSDTQPHEPSLGSVFKRTELGSAARLIDLAGLKGLRVGDAEISTKHAGFIVNRGGATAKDYLALSAIAAERVFDRFGVSLVREIEILD